MTVDGVSGMVNSGVAHREGYARPTCPSLRIFGGRAGATDSRLRDRMGNATAVSAIELSLRWRTVVLSRYQHGEHFPVL